MMVITILRRIYCYYDFDSVFTTYRIGGFIFIQVKSSALDRIYMMMILLQVIVILHDPDYRPVQLYVLLYEFDSLSICIPTPYPIRCY